MQPSSWDTLFNVAIFLFWFRIWDRENRDTDFNAYLRPIARLSRQVFHFLDPLFFGASRWIGATVSVVFLLIFRGLLVYQLAAMRPGHWSLEFGLSHAVADSVGQAVLLSALSFLKFLFTLWSLSLLYAVVVRTRTDYPKSALFRLAAPLTQLPPAWRPAALTLSGIAMAAAMFPGTRVPAPRLLGAFLSALAAFLDVFMIVASCLFLLVVGTWVGTMLNNRALARHCHDWLRLLVGPARRYPLQLGTLDLTPLVCAMVITMLHPQLVKWLENLLFRMAG